MKKLMLTLSMALVAFTLSAQAPSPQQTPQLEFVLQLRVTLGQAYSVGETPHGRRTVIPITGGTFEGPKVKGTIINGGADYQLADPKTNRTELSRPTTGSIFTCATKVSSAASPAMTAALRSISGPPRGSRHPATAHTLGSTTPSSYALPTGLSRAASHSTCGK